MIEGSQPGRAAAAADDLKGRIVAFMRGASTEITPSEQSRLAELTAVLPAGAAVYVAHTPNAAFTEVIHAALAVQRLGFLATPHIAVRRVADSRALRAGLEALRAGGVEHILLIAGDAPRPMGEYSSTLDVLRSGVLRECGIAHIGIAGHPEGHNAVAAQVLWEALAAKQAMASSAATSMHIVTQFGFDGGAFQRWRQELALRRIHLPVRIGIAGPAPLAKLMHFALQCGIGAALRTAARKAGAAAQAAERAMSPDRHLLTLLRTPVPAQIVAPHFFAFGGALRTAQWMRSIAAGDFDIDAGAGRLVVRDVRPSWRE